MIITVPLLTLQADTVRNAAFAASADSFLERYEYTTPLQSLRGSLRLCSVTNSSLSLVVNCVLDISRAASVIADWQIGLQHSFRGSTVLQANWSTALFQV
jgi:hypothetical protein